MTKRKPSPTRRTFLGKAATGLTLLGCASTRDSSDAFAGPGKAGQASKTNPSTDDASAAPQGRALKTCTRTEDNIEGPFFKSGAPNRSVLVMKADEGQRLLLKGRVLDTRCRAIAGAQIEIWHADHKGAYDNQGFRFRGQLRSASDGTFRLQSIIPGRYLNGKQYRPAHIHFKLASQAKRALTTQLYFEGDPYNKIDPFIRESLILKPERKRGLVHARYDFVLAEQ